MAEGSNGAGGAPRDARSGVQRGRRTLAPFGRREVGVEANDGVGPYRLLVVADALGPAGPCPGQFYMLSSVESWGGGRDDRPYLPRAFSFARARDGRLSFLLDRIGPGTERLGRLGSGDSMWLTGPLGVGFDLTERSRIVLVGGGIGAAPILAARDELGEAATVLLGFRTGAHATVGELFPGAPEVVTDDGAVGRRALVTQLLQEELDAPGGGGVQVLACGPPRMLEAVRAVCAEHEVPAQLALESGMACGFGACFGCVVATRSGYVRLCVDGPVLQAAELERVPA
jgi:dihydroorotate dehydrogenase electron transfer subunit